MEKQDAEQDSSKGGFQGPAEGSSKGALQGPTEGSSKGASQGPTEGSSKGASRSDLLKDLALHLETGPAEGG